MLTVIMLGMHRQPRTTALADFNKPVFSQHTNPHCLLLSETQNILTKFFEIEYKIF